MKGSIEKGLHWELEPPLPEALACKGGNGLFLSGWCFHEAQPIAGLQIRVNGQRFPVAAHSTTRDDVKTRYQSDRALSSFVRQSGFWAFLVIEDPLQETTATIELHAVLADGSRIQCELGQLKLMPLPARSAVPPLAPAVMRREDYVAICMTTYNPPLPLIRRQIESIYQQTHSNWICLISDDGSSAEVVAEIQRLIQNDHRFVFYPFSNRLGFYGNFERCLRLVPAETAFVCLADHDDNWYPEKVSSLLAAFDADTMLTYSDMRVVDESGQLLANSFWGTRKNNYTNLTDLLIVNTVTGAASMFRRSLVDLALPFPPQVGNLYHDHWIATLALACGKIQFIDRPLYDYVQHGGNVIGHHEITFFPLVRTLYYTFRQLGTVPGRAYAREFYFKEVLRTCIIARVASLRLRNRMGRKPGKIFARISRLDQSPLMALWLVLHGLRRREKVSVTMHSEYFLALGIFWKFITQAKAFLLLLKYKVSDIFTAVRGGGR